MEWILWNPKNQTALVVIPEEVEVLIPLIRAKGHQNNTVHLVTYMAPFTKDMVHFSNLSYYTLPPLPSGHRVPEWLSMELGIFAGRMYANFSECTAFKNYLASSDGAGFSTNPADFLLDWLTLRRKGQDVLQTPVGYVCQGRQLREDHFFFVTSPDDLGNTSARSLKEARLAADSDSDDGDSEMEWSTEEEEL